MKNANYVMHHSYYDGIPLKGIGSAYGIWNDAEKNDLRFNIY